MAHRAIPIIAFHGVYMFVSLARLCVVYIVKRLSRGLGQLMGVARKRTRVRGSSSYRQARKIQKLFHIAEKQYKYYARIFNK